MTTILNVQNAPPGKSKRQYHLSAVLQVLMLVLHQFRHRILEAEAAEESAPAEQLVQTDIASFNGVDCPLESIALQYSFHHH
jgi:hypothetical protein